MDQSDDGATYAKHSRELIRFATALVGPIGAEDLLATTVLRSIGTRRWPQIENKRAYLYRVMWNEAARSRRSTQRRLERESRVAGSDLDERDPGDSSDVEVIALIARLELRQRAVVFLTYWSDLEPSTVASMIGVSKRTVERELTAARRSLKEMLS